MGVIVMNHLEQWRRKCYWNRKIWRRLVVSSMSRGKWGQFWVNTMHYAI